MPRRRPAGGRDGHAPEAKPATYTLHGGEPAAIRLAEVKLGDVGLWLERTLSLTSEAPGGAVIVADLHRRILSGLGVLRDGVGTAEAVRDAAEEAIVAALILGFHHPGGTAMVAKIEADLKALRDAKRVKDMNAGRTRPSELVEHITVMRNDYLSRHSSSKINTAAIARHIVKVTRSSLSRGEPNPTSIRALFQCEERDIPALVERVRRALRDLDEQ